MLRISSISASIRLIRFPCFRYFLRYDFFALFSFFKFSVCNGIHLRCNVILPCQIFRNAYALVSRSLKSLQRLCIMPALQFLIMLLSVPPLLFSASFLLQIITFYPLNTSGSDIHATTLYGSPASSNQTPVWE